MCAVSNVHDYFKNTYPLPQYPDYSKDYGWTKVRWEEYQELVRKAKEYDKLTKQPDCEDPSKAAFEQQVKEYLIKIGVIHQNK